MLQTIQPCRSRFAFGIPTSTSRFAAHRFDHSFCFFSTSCRPKNGFIRQKALRIRAFSSGTDLKEERDNSSRMTIAPGISIANRKLIVCGKTILSKVPENIILTPDSQTGFGNGAFIGATSSESRSKLVFPIGVLEDLRFMCCFRFKLWWMMQRMGTFGKDVPFETQFLLLESREGSPLSGEMNYGTDDNKIYIVFLPLLDGSFRTSLQGNEKNELEMCLESGDPTIQTSSSMNAVYVRAGTDPFQVIKEAVRAVETHMGTFSHREEKKMPGMLDWFGWCTWDAFYTDVSAEAVIEGLESFTAGEVPPRFLIIDDGWQSVEVDQKQNLDVVITSGTQLASRLVHIKENHKFQKDGKVGERVNEPALGLQLIVKEAKEKYHLKYVYVWHAITGYWGGVHPDMEQFESVITYPSPSPGVIENQPDFAADSLIVNGLGLVNPKRAFHFYNEMHSYLASAGVDGVKVDVQSILETLGSGHGGRVKLTSQYHQALEESIACNFPDNGCIACMSHNTDSLFCSKQTAVVRASDDFWPKDPASHTIHIASVAYNSIFLGEFMQPDWDMFHSLHPAAEYHAAARAVGGCGVYVSDKPGNHNFELLKKLVLPDGSILRAQLPGRPTCDSLFSDPTRDQSSLLKIWNMNKYTGVIGAFNCQGAAWCIVDKVAKIHDKNPKAITGSIHARDVPLLKDIAGSGWNHEIVVYGHRNEELVRLPRSAALPITLEVLNFEIFTIVPLKNLTSGLFFAPIGLLKMYNSGGAIQLLEYQNLAKPNNESANCIEPNDTSSIATVEMKVKGCGTFGSYSSVKPKCCSLETSPVDFKYNCENGLLTVELPLPKEGQLWNLRIEF